MTKAETVISHRKMWNWIAEQTKKRRVIVKKVAYFDAMNIEYEQRPHCNCFCCQYEKEVRNFTNKECQCCPILWGTESTNEMLYCCKDDSAFAQWRIACKWNDWWKAAKFAQQIAELPEKE